MWAVGPRQKGTNFEGGGVVVFGNDPSSCWGERRTAVPLVEGGGTVMMGRPSEVRLEWCSQLFRGDVLVGPKSKQQ